VVVGREKCGDRIDLLADVPVGPSCSTQVFDIFLFPTGSRATSRGRGGSFPLVVSSSSSEILGAIVDIAPCLLHSHRQDGARVAMLVINIVKEAASGSDAGIAILCLLVAGVESNRIGKSCEVLMARDEGFHLRFGNQEMLHTTRVLSF
jgi:hypothetical protein